MSNITLPSDYVGEYHISQEKYGTFQTYLDGNEKAILIELLGAGLYSEFAADLDGDNLPVSDRFVQIYEEKFFDDDKKVVHSKGMKEMLLGFIYAGYVTKTGVMHTGTGLVSNLNENSTVEMSEKGAQHTQTKYYQAVKTYQAIQRYIELNRSTYPNFNGQAKEAQAIFI